MNLVKEGGGGYDKGTRSSIARSHNSGEGRGGEVKRMKFKCLKDAKKKKSKN